MPDTLMNWEGNPKRQFDLRRLERCYNLDVAAPVPQKTNKSMLRVLFSPIKFVSMIIIGSLVVGVVSCVTEVDRTPTNDYNENVPSVSE